jgi:hypothetical protein
MLIFTIDDILKSTVNIIQDLLCTLIRLVDGTSFILLILLRAAASFGEIVQHAQFLWTLFQRSL